MFNSSSPSLADIAAVTNNDNDGFGSGNGWWVLILLLAAFGGFGNGWGYGGNSGNGVASDIQRSFDTQSLTGQLSSIQESIADQSYAQLSQMNNIQQSIGQSAQNTQTQNMLGSIKQGICDLGYNQMNQVNGINNNLTQFAFGMQNSMLNNTNNILAQMQDNFTQNREAVAQSRFDIAQNTCAITTAINTGVRDVIESNNANYRALSDQLTAAQMQAKDDKIAQQAQEIQSLRFANSQADQNAFIENRLDQLQSTLRPTPVPAFNVANPYSGLGYGCYCNGNSMN